MGLWKHLDWRGATRSEIEALKILFQVKLTKMPPINPRLTKSQSWSKSFQNHIFHVSTLHGDFRQVWPYIDSWGPQKP